MALERLFNELRHWEIDPPDTVFAKPIDDDDLFHWHGEILGPIETSFEGGRFLVDIQMNADYPFKPPKCRMITKVFHTYIYIDGKICMNVLRHDWSTALTIEKVLLSISSFLDLTEVEGVAANPEAAKCFQDRNRYNAIVRQYTQDFAK